MATKLVTTAPEMGIYCFCERVLGLRHVCCLIVAALSGRRGCVLRGVHCHPSAQVVLQRLAGIQSSGACWIFVWCVGCVRVVVIGVAALPAEQAAARGTQHRYYLFAMST